MGLHDPAVLGPMHQVIAQAHQVPNGPVQPLPAEAESVNAQLQAHARVTLVIGKLDVGDELVEDVHGFVLGFFGLGFDDVLEDLLERGRRLRDLPVPNIILLVIRHDHAGPVERVALLLFVPEFHAHGLGVQAVVLIADLHGGVDVQSLLELLHLGLLEGIRLEEATLKVVVQGGEEVVS